MRTWLPKRCSEPRRRKIWTRRKSFSTSKKAFQTQRHTAGKTNTGRGNHDTSIRFTLATNGTNIIRRTTSTYFAPCIVKLTKLSLVRTTLLPRSCRDTNSTSSTPISSKAQRLHRMLRLRSLATTRRWCSGLPLDPLTRISPSESSTGTGSFHTRSKQLLLLISHL